MNEADKKSAEILRRILNGMEPKNIQCHFACSGNRPEKEELEEIAKFQENLINPVGHTINELRKEYGLPEIPGGDFIIT